MRVVRLDYAHFSQVKSMSIRADGTDSTDRLIALLRPRSYPQEIRVVHVSHAVFIQVKLMSIQRVTHPSRGEGVTASSAREGHPLSWHRFHSRKVRVIQMDYPRRVARVISRVPCPFGHVAYRREYPPWTAATKSVDAFFFVITSRVGYLGLSHALTICQLRTVLMLMMMPIQKMAHPGDRLSKGSKQKDRSPEISHEIKAKSPGNILMGLQGREGLCLHGKRHVPCVLPR